MPEPELDSEKQSIIKHMAMQHMVLWNWNGSFSMIRKGLKINTINPTYLAYVMQSSSYKPPLLNGTMKMYIFVSA